MLLPKPPTEKPLPADIKAVQRLVGARSKEELNAVETVLNEFFVLEDDGWHNPRCDSELAIYFEKSDKAKASANARWKSSSSNANAMRTHNERNAPIGANAIRTHMPTQCEGNANQEPLPESVPTPTEEPIVTNENDVMAIANPKEIPNFTPRALTQEEIDALNAVSESDYDEDDVIEPTDEDDVYLERIKEIPVDLEIEPEEIPDVERPGDYVTPPVDEELTVVQNQPHAMPHPGRKSRGVPSPVVQAQADNIEEKLGTPSKSDFGNEFPINPEKGDTFLRVDYLPNRLFKFNGQKWIQIDKEQTDIYVYNDMYIKHLIEEIDSGRYDTDSLTDVEREQITHYLSKNSA